MLEVLTCLAGIVPIWDFLQEGNLMRGYAFIWLIHVLQIFSLCALVSATLVHSQETDVTQTSNFEQAEIKKSLAEQIGTGPGRYQYARFLALHY